jgi:hypothetical protein
MANSAKVPGAPAAIAGPVTRHNATSAKAATTRRPHAYRTPSIRRHRTPPRRACQRTRQTVRGRYQGLSVPARAHLPPLSSRLFGVAPATKVGGCVVASPDSRNVMGGCEPEG